VEVETQWSIDDVWEAHMVLDLYDAAEEKAARELESQTAKRRRR
jgi:hypothetical protein